jgi:hypothetical protein
MQLVTVRQVAEKMIEDTTKKARGVLVRKKMRKVWKDGRRYTASGSYETYMYEDKEETGEVASSCAIGGAAVLLGVNPASLQIALLKVDRDGVTKRTKAVANRIGHVIIDYNDSTGTSKADIGRHILSQADEKTLNTVLEVEPAA